MALRPYNSHPALVILAAIVAGCSTEPQPIRPPEFHVAPGFTRNTAPPPNLPVQAYVGIPRGIEDAEVQAAQDAIVGATYMAKMAADPRGLRFHRVEEQIRFTDTARAYNFGISIPERRYGGLTVTGTAMRSTAVLTQMARLDVAEVAATLTNPTAEALAFAIQQCYWEAIRKFAAEKYAIDLSGPLHGNLAMVDFRIDEDIDSLTIAMQINVQFPKRKRRAKPRASAGGKPKWRRPLHDLPPEMQEYLKNRGTSLRRITPRKTRKSSTPRELPPEMREALKKYQDGKR